MVGATFPGRPYFAPAIGNDEGWYHESGSFRGVPFRIAQQGKGMPKLSRQVLSSIARIGTDRKHCRLLLAEDSHMPG